MNVVMATVLSGVLVFTISQLVQKMILDPFLEFKKVVSRIDNKLKFYNNKICNVGFEKKELDELRNIIRELSCDIESAYKLIPFKRILFRFLPSPKDMTIVSTRLIRLSNCAGQKQEQVINIWLPLANANDIREIRKILKIETLEDSASFCLSFNDTLECIKKQTNNEEKKINN